MIVQMAGNRTGFSRRPELVTMEGELALMGVQPRDQIIFQKGYLTPQEINYIASRYPELMGFLPLLLAAIPGIAAGAASIIGAVKGGKKDSPQNVEANNTAVLQAQLAAQQAQQQAAQQAAAQQANTMKTLAMVGIPAALIIMMMMMNRKK